VCGTPALFNCFIKYRRFVALEVTASTWEWYEKSRCKPSSSCMISPTQELVWRTLLLRSVSQVRRA